MLVLAILLALAVGWVRGGKISRLADFQLALPWLIVVAFLVQAMLPRLSLASLAGYRFVLLILSYILLLWALSRNEFNWGIILSTMGVFFNFAVILVNGGMPVSSTAVRAVGYTGSLSRLETVRDGIHVLLQPTTRLPWLADIIPQPLPSPFGGVASVGDILLALGVFMLIQSKMIYVGRRRKNRESVLQ